MRVRKLKSRLITSATLGTCLASGMGDFGYFAPCGDNTPPRAKPPQPPLNQISRTERGVKTTKISRVPWTLTKLTSKLGGIDPRWSNCFVYTVSGLLETSERVLTGFRCFRMVFDSFHLFLHGFLAEFHRFYRHVAHPRCLGDVADRKLGSRMDAPNFDFWVALKTHKSCVHFNR